MSSASPYKFLDSYEVGDRAVFFGRERETEVLLADIVLNRLVVLFSRTGTGKTSLINAALRPALAQRGYGTFFVRVRRDPIASAREALAEDDRVGPVEDGSLRGVLSHAVAALEQPIVVIFDQFEEFFLYAVRDDREQAAGFVAELAGVYRDQRLPVHVVLSMREDFYVELDVFRDAIPTIFHNDSNLRLRWFDRAQARDAIVKPLAARDTTIAEELVERLLDDLALRRSLIEPAQLQIVCDTLWRSCPDGPITLGSYARLGQAGGASEATIAEQIVSRRLVEQFEEFGSREELAVLERLLDPGVLSTERGTKYVRDVPGLARELADVLAPDGGEAALGAILERLAASRLVRLYVRDELLQVELMHDYLVAEPERLAELRTAVGNIWPHRVLEAARTGGAPDAELEDVLQRAEDEWAERRRNPRAGAGHLRLSAEDAALLLRFALSVGGSALVSYAIAEERGAPAWAILIETCRGPSLAAAVGAVGVLSKLGSSEAVGTLGELLGDERLAREAQAALTEIAHAGALPTSTEAEQVLVAYLRGMLDDPELAPMALEDLGRLDSPAAVELLAEVAADGRLGEAARGALRRAAGSRSEHVAGRARSVLSALAAPSVVAPAAPAPMAVASSPSEPALVRRPATTSGDVGETDVSLVASSLRRGRLVIFLGNEFNACGDESGRSPPTHRQLAETLARDFGLPVTGRPLPEVAQAVATMRGRPFDEPLDPLLATEPNALHRFIAALPNLLRQVGGSAAPLVVTTAYDDALERAFAEAGTPFDVIARWRGGTPIDIPVDERTIIVKPLGTQGGRLVMTEDEFLALLGDSDPAAALPAVLAERIQRSELLFLAHPIGDWSARGLVDWLLLRDRKRGYRGWAITPHFDGLELALWAQRDVRAQNADLVEYARVLAGFLASVKP